MTSAVACDDSATSSDDQGRAAVIKSEFLAVLANRQRMHILFLLIEGECSVGELMQELRETPVGVSRHLIILRDNNIIRSRRCGKSVRYSLTCPRVAQMVKALSDICCDKDAEQMCSLGELELVTS